MAAGVIPIVSDIAANRIWIRDGENGFLFPIGDPGVLAAKIVRAWRERDWRARVVEQNRALVLREHDRDVNMKKMEQGWVELVRNSHP
jgi:glycosyltransferase involved in cell wall biosynthesis